MGASSHLSRLIYSGGLGAARHMGRMGLTVENGAWRGAVASEAAWHKLAGYIGMAHGQSLGDKSRKGRNVNSIA